MKTNLPVIIPDWPAPANIRALSTTRTGGCSLPPYQQLNLGMHVGDEEFRVINNRHLLSTSKKLPQPPRWLKQIHSTQVINTQDWYAGIEADACISQTTEAVCAVMTADCLPILLCDVQGNHVAAIHAGWRGLAAGIIENTIAKMACHSNKLIAWLGPAIGPSAFEVGTEVRKAFVDINATDAVAFSAHDSQWLADLYLLAQHRLKAAGISAIYGGNFCTFTDQQRFFSYRRDGVTGRMATMIWIDYK